MDWINIILKNIFTKVYINLKRNVVIDVFKMTDECIEYIDLDILYVINKN